MPEESPAMTAFEQARRDAKRRKPDPMNFWDPLTMYMMVCGGLATAGLTIAVALGEASPFIWEIPRSDVWPFMAAVYAAYVLSYAFILGVASIALNSYSNQQLNIWTNLSWSMWFLVTVLLFEVPVVRAVEVFFENLPNSIGGRALMVVWAIAAIFAVKIVMIMRRWRADAKRLGTSHQSSRGASSI